MILNIGCGEELYGNIRCDIVHTGSVNILASALKLPFRDNVFNEVYSKCVFEHVTNHQGFLEEQVRVLKKGGIIKLITDNAGFWRFHILGSHVKPKIKSKWLCEYKGLRDVDRHYALFTPEHLKNHFSRLKVKILKVELGLYDDSPSTSINFSFIERILSSINIFKNLMLPRIMIIVKKA
jgi:SAM-dependent methyltransferase